MQTVRLPSGEQVPALGQGTWFLGDDEATRSTEIKALRRGLDRGLGLIDTAEMYGGGRAERLVGQAIADRRDDAFLVSKLLPGNAGREDAVRACEASLERLGVETLDLYLLHWPGSVAFEETIDAFEQLQTDGKIRYFGVSNVDYDAIDHFLEAPGGRATQANQLLYNLNQRGIEWDLLEYLQSRGIATMAYSPFDGGSLLAHDGLMAFAKERDLTTAQVALAWLLHQPGVIPIPKSARPERVAENAGALDVSLSDSDLLELDSMFAPPLGPTPLEIY